MKQKRFFIALCVTLLSLTTSHAQCTMNNTAFQSGEYLTYNLYFNWKFVWVKVGVASMSTVKNNYQGKEAYRCSLITRGNGKLDAVFTMRDTLLSYLSTQLVPLYFRKGAEEGKHYTIDEVFYTYTSDRCNMRMFRKKDKNGPTPVTKDVWLTCSTSSSEPAISTTQNGNRVTRSNCLWPTVTVWRKQH